MNIVEILQNNGVGVIATDTVYGVVACLSSPAAVERIYHVKKRDLEKPVGTILIASTDQISDIVDKNLLTEASKYWPGPVSVVLPVNSLEYAHRGVGSLAFRIPKDDKLVALLEQTGPLASSSANIQAEDPATNIDKARQVFGDLVDFYEDGGDLSHKKASRIIRLNNSGNIDIVRE